MITQLRVLLPVVIAGLASGCLSHDITKDMGPQAFRDPCVQSAGSGDPGIASAVDSAVAVASECGFHYDASGSQTGRVIVTALWKGDPVKLTMRFLRKEEMLYIADMMTIGGATPLEKASRVADLYYGRLAEETQRRGLRIQGDPTAIP